MTTEYPSCCPCSTLYSCTLVKPSRRKGPPLLLSSSCLAPPLLLLPLIRSLIARDAAPRSIRGEGGNGAARAVRLGRCWWRGKEGEKGGFGGAMVGGPAMAPAAGPGAAAAAVAGSAAAEEMRWRQLDSGMSAVSFGFVATAILVSMFLAMAILEHFLRAPARAPGMGGTGAPPRGGILPRLRLLRHGAGEASGPSADLEAVMKLDGRASPEMPVYAKGVSVLMPGHDVPTFIAHPAPAPCPPERIQWPSHQPTPFADSSSNPS